MSFVNKEKENVIKAINKAWNIERAFYEQYIVRLYVDINYSLRVVSDIQCELEIAKEEGTFSSIDPSNIKIKCGHMLNLWDISSRQNGLKDEVRTFLRFDKKKSEEIDWDQCKLEQSYGALVFLLLATVNGGLYYGKQLYKNESRGWVVPFVAGVGFGLIEGAIDTLFVSKLLNLWKDYTARDTVEEFKEVKSRLEYVLLLILQLENLIEDIFTILKCFREYASKNKSKSTAVGVRVRSQTAKMIDNSKELITGLKRMENKCEEILKSCKQLSEFDTSIKFT